MLQRFGLPDMIQGNDDPVSDSVESVTSPNGGIDNRTPTLCFFPNPSPWESLVKLLVFNPQYGWNVIHRIFRPGYIDLTSAGTITLAETPKPGRTFQTEKWRAQEISCVEVKRISKKSMFGILLFRWLQLAVIVGVSSYLLVTGYCLIYMSQAPYLGEGLLHLIWMAAVFGIFIGFMSGFLYPVSDVIWFRYSEFVVVAGYRRVPFISFAEDESSIADQLADFGIRLVDSEADVYSESTLDSVNTGTTQSLSSSRGGKAPLEQISCASCGQSFYGAVREDGSCPLCGEATKPQV